MKAANSSVSLEYVGTATPLSGDESFAPVYFGGSPSLESASLVNIGLGGKARADFTLRDEAAWRVSGTLNGFIPRTPIKFELVNSAGDATVVRDSVNGDVGRFAVGPAVPGSYTLRATQGRSVAQTAITVQSRDLTGV